MDVRLSTESILAWRFNHRGTIYEFQIDTKLRQLVVSDNKSGFRPVTQAIPAAAFSDQNTIVEFSSFDLRLEVWVNGIQTFSRELEESQLPVADQLLDFGAAGGDLRFERIQIWRDLYYYSENINAGSANIGPDGYFVIGDNVPVSIGQSPMECFRFARSAIVIGKVEGAVIIGI